MADNERVVEVLGFCHQDNSALRSACASYPPAPATLLYTRSGPPLTTQNCEIPDRLLRGVTLCLVVLDKRMRPPDWLLTRVIQYVPRGYFFLALVGPFLSESFPPPVIRGNLNTILSHITSSPFVDDHRSSSLRSPL